jgi:hypothetical protein
MDFGALMLWGASVLVLLALLAVLGVSLLALVGWAVGHVAGLFSSARHGVVAVPDLWTIMRVAAALLAASMAAQIVAQDPLRGILFGIEPSAMQELARTVGNFVVDVIQGIAPPLPSR